MTELTLGPLILPLDRDEQRKATNFARIVTERGGEMWLLRDHVIGCIYAWATIPGPKLEVAAATSGATP